jgi:transcription initiation factor TFIIB
MCSEYDLVVGHCVLGVRSAWRTFSNEKAGADPSRVCGPQNPFLYGSDLSLIGRGRGGASFGAFGVLKSKRVEILVVHIDH